MPKASIPTEAAGQPLCEQRTLLLQRLAAELGMTIEEFREADHRHLIEECLDALKAQLDRED